MKNVIKRDMILFAVLSGLLLTLLTIKGFCVDVQRKITGFDHLLKVVESEQTAFEPEKVTSILDYVSANATTPEPEKHLDGLDNATFAYHSFDVDTDMVRLLKYCYNPDIPPCAVMPSEIRLSSWTDFNGKKISITPSLWSRLDGDQQPVVVRGIFYMQNTPEQTTGAYYGYNSYRTVILLKYKGRNVLISVLKQKDVSDVGKKGFTLGRKDDVDYFYSGEQGLNVSGLGWIKSYLYDSCSVSVYIEKKAHEKGLRCGIFKWIRGGWAGNNMIRKAHVLKGLERYAGKFKTIMESKDFPEPEELAETCSALNSLPRDDMKKKVEILIQAYKGKCPSSPKCPKALKSESELENYVNKMSRIEMSSALIVDYVKHILSKSEKAGKIATSREPITPSAF